MADEELVSGVVVGDEGAVIAGYAKLGANGKRRAIATTVKVRTDDGHEVELVELTPSTIDPVVTKTEEWSELERQPGASACIEDAPAPDVEIELFSALVRGGDRIAAWGPVREHVLEGAGDGGAYRESAKRRVVVMAPVMVFIGDRCVERLERLRATPAHVPVRPPSEPKPVAAPKPPSPWSELRTVPLGLWIAPPFVLFFSIVALLRGAWSGASAIAVIGAAFILPLATDAFGVENFREPSTPKSRTAATAGGVFALAFFVCSALVTASYDVNAPMFNAKLALASAAVFLVMVCWIYQATSNRRRLLRLVVDAPAHVTPIVDGVWGAVDGRASAKEPCTVDKQPCIVVYGTVFVGENHDPKIEAVDDIVVEHDGARTVVRFGGALWFSTVSYENMISDGRITADVIRDRAMVRVVGRAKGGVIAKGGDESLLVFATDVDGDPIAFAKKIAFWNVTSNAFALAGVAVLATALVLALGAMT